MSLTSFTASIMISGPPAVTREIAEKLFGFIDDDSASMILAGSPVETSRIELFHIPVTNDEEKFDVSYKESMDKMTKSLKQLPTDFAKNEFRKAESVRIFFGGWSGQSEQIDNMPLGIEFINELARLSLEIEYLINDYHR